MVTPRWNGPEPAIVSSARSRGALVPVSRTAQLLRPIVMAVGARLAIDHISDRFASEARSNRTVAPVNYSESGQPAIARRT